ncbi:MAG: (d)CMP kinase [Candidatus Borkfalkiaceae bacterium]|nr:(d)CMP kinase [Christensenellaceae bacterium]
MINVALDGPAGSGKSTVARLIAKKLDILYLDTGAMYRACGLKCKRLGLDAEKEEDVKKFIDGIDLAIRYENSAQHTFLDGEDVSEEIRKPDVSMLASAVSAHPCVRVKMVEMQRNIARQTDCVLDGRDIGSYVLPDAKYKFFVTADPKIRAERRFRELTEKGMKVDFDRLYEEILERDYNDSHRTFAPLVRAEDAVLLDTSAMTPDEVVDFVLSRITKED